MGSPRTTALREVITVSMRLVMPVTSATSVTSLLPELAGVESKTDNGHTVPCCWQAAVNGALLLTSAQFVPHLTTPVSSAYARTEPSGASAFDTADPTRQVILTVAERVPRGS